MLLPHFMNNNEFPDAVFLASRLPEQMLTRHTGASQALLCEGLPIPVHEGLDGHGGADIGRVVPLAEEALQQVGPARRIQHGYPGAYRGLAYYLVTVPEVLRAGHAGEIGVVHKAGNFLARMALHALHERDELFRGAGHRAAGVHHVEDLQAALGQCCKILMVAAESRGSGGVAADVEDDRVPVQRKGGGNLRREGERLHATSIILSS